MKPWEMVKDLDENPDRVFEDGDGNYLKFTDEGLLAWHSLTGEFCGLYTVHRNDATNWNLVRQPVTWQEAIQAWSAGKRVRVRTIQWDHVFSPIEKVEVSPMMIQDGIWYVED